MWTIPFHKQAPKILKSTNASRLQRGKQLNKIGNQLYSEIYTSQQPTKK